MEPTTIKTGTTKLLKDLARGSSARIRVGGVEHNIRRRDDGSFSTQSRDTSGQYGCHHGTASEGALSPNAQVTVTYTRPMTVDDLEFGDCFVTADCLKGDAFCVCVDDSETGYVKALRVCVESVRPVSMAFRGDEVTLVTPSFEAEAVCDTETVPVSEVDTEFEYLGRKGKRCGIAKGDNGLEWSMVKWSGLYGIDRIPDDTPVTVHTDASYDSWEDVSVGDVFIFDEQASGIYLGNGKGLFFDGIMSKVINPAHLPSDLTTATLTSVDWTRVPEVER